MDDGTEVSVETGLRAAEKLQSVLDGRERGTDVLELKVQLGQISQAVRAVVPQSMWAAIVEQLEELEQHPEALDVGRTPSMTTTTLTTRPSSSTRTTSFDVGLDWRYRGRSRDVHRFIGSRSKRKRWEEEWPWQI